MSEKCREYAFEAVCFLIPLFFLCTYSGWLQFVGIGSLRARMIVGIVLLIALIVFSMDRPLHEVVWRKVLYIPLLLCGLGLIVTGLHHSIGEGFMLFGFQLVFVFPCLALVWNNRTDYEKLFDTIARGFAVVGILYFILCIFLAATGHFVMIGGRWAGTMGNVNSLGFYGVHILLASLYLLVRNIGKASQMPYFAAAGIGLGFVLLSGSRVSLLDCIMCFAAWTIYIIVHRKSIPSVLSKPIIIRCCLGVLLFFIMLTAAFVFIPSLQTSHDKQVNGEIKSETTESITDRFDPRKNDGINDYSSGRVGLWKKYAKRLNLIGHDYDKTDWDKIDGGAKMGAHNLFLGISYRCGVPVGIVFVFLEVMVGLVAVVLLFDRKCIRQSFLFLILFVIEYGIDSSLDNSVIPFSRAGALLFYIGMICIMPGRPSLRSSRANANHQGVVKQSHM